MLALQGGHLSKITNQEDEFYADLDKRTTRRSCCTWQTFILFFVGLSLIASGLTVYVFYKVKQAGFSIEKLYPSTVSKESFLAKLKIDKQKNPTFSITINSQELTSVLGSGIKATTFEIKDVQAEIDEINIIVFGKLTKPLKADIKIETAPSPQDGKVFLKVTKITAGKLVLPGFLNSEIEKALNNLMDENFVTLYENYQVSDVKLEQDSMIISGRLK